MINELISLLTGSTIMKLVVLCIALDTLLGALRAFKQHKFNSSVGIDGAIRKVAMIACMAVLMLADLIIHINIVGFVPEEYLAAVNIKKVGMCELFGLLFICYECISILKNMLLCGLPIPKKVREWLVKFMDEMTAELPGEEEKEVEDNVSHI